MPRKTVVFRPRFAAEVDASLRQHVSRRGELLKLIILTLKTVDLTTVPLLEISSNILESASTSVKLPGFLHARLKRIAMKRESTMNALLNSAVWEYTTGKQDQDPK